MDVTVQLQAPAIYLSDEILNEIFSYLSLETREVIEDVCSRWREISRTYPWCIDLIGINSSICNNPIYFKIFENHGWRIRELHYIGFRKVPKPGEEDSIECHAKSFCEEKDFLKMAQRCTNVRKLTLQFSAVSSSQPFEAMCEHLSILQLINCDLKKSSAIAQFLRRCALKRLDLVSLWNFEESDFRGIECGELKHLNLACLKSSTFKIDCDGLEHLRIVKCPSLSERDVAELVRGSAGTLRRLTLKELNFRAKKSDEKVWSAIRLCKNLRCLILSSDAYSADDLNALAEHCKVLTELRLDFPDEGCLKVLKKMANVRKLVLTRARKNTFNRQTIESLGTCPILNRIDVKEHGHLSGESLVSLLIACEALIELNVYPCVSGFDDKCRYEIGKTGFRVKTDHDGLHFYRQREDRIFAGF